MERRKLIDLNCEELLQVLEHNNKFACKVLEDAHENYSYFVCEDYLHNAPKCASYEIGGGCCQGEHFNFNNAIENYSDICDYLNKLHDDFGLFDDKYKDIEKLFVIGSHYEEYYHSDENYNRMYARFKEIITYFEKYIFEFLQDIYSMFYDNRELANYLCEEVNQDYYNNIEVDEHNNVFEAISYINEYIC